MSLSAIILLVGLVYCRTPATYFCAYDDFLEVHRAAFEDTRDPSRVFTTTHFQSYKYRPLNRGLNLLSYRLGGGDAAYFRARNLVFHLLNVALVYALAWLLFGRRWTAAAAALLFGLHPLANQSVVGAVMTNTAAHTGFLLSLVCFLISLRRTRRWPVWLALALAAAWLSLLAYEAAIAVFPLMFAYLFLHWFFTREKLADARFLLALVAGCALALGAFFWMRALYVTAGARQALPGARALVKNALMYATALLSPVDVVLANEWLGTPLPSELYFGGVSAWWWAVVAVGVCAAAFAALALVSHLRRQLPADARAKMLFLLAAILASLLPLLVFTDKASETYLYLPAAFAAVLFGAALETFFLAGAGGRKRRPAVAFAAVGILCLLFGGATWVRNGRVARCGETARRIVTELPAEKLRAGAWTVKLASAPGEPTSRRYGMYGWRGVDTIGATAAQAAMQLVSQNEELAAEVIAPEAVARDCAGARDVCLWVHEDGRVSEIGGRSAGR